MIGTNALTGGENRDKPHSKVAVQLLDRDVALVEEAAVDGAEASLADEEGTAEGARGRFQVGEGEKTEIVGAALRQEMVQVHRVRELRRLGVEVGATAAIVRVHQA